MIGAIENAMLGRLKAAADAEVLGYRYGSLETYPVDWDDLLKETRGELVPPAAWVIFGGWSRSSSTGKAIRLPAMFGVVVMAENKRNESTRRHGDPVNPLIPGSYQMALDVVALLNGEDFGLDIDTLQVGACRLVRPPEALKQRKVSMYFIEFYTAFAPGDRSEAIPNLGDFETFHANWDIPAFGNVDADEEEEGPQIPADETADATDHVTLETAP